MGDLLARATRRPTLAHIRHVTPVPPAAATGLVAQVYRQVERDFGMLAPPVSLHSPAPGALAATWAMLRETLIATGLADREAKEAVAAAVSSANRCPYCVEVHGATLVGLVRGSDAMAVATDDLGGVRDPALRVLAAWAHASQAGDVTQRHPPPFPTAHGPELIGVAVVFHYLNRMVNVFLQPSPLPAAVPAVMRPRMRRMAGRLMASLARAHRDPGEALDLLAPAPLPADLSWAAGQPSIADAFARASAVIDRGGECAVPDDVRQLVAVTLSGWTGQPPGLGGRAWVDEALGGLPAVDRPAGRLALLTALASYQITDGVIDEFRRAHPDDRRLIELTSWASLAAARQVGARLQRDLLAPGPTSSPDATEA